MQRARAPTMLIGGQRATILQQTSSPGVQQQNSPSSRLLRPSGNPSQQPTLPQTPVRMVSSSILGHSLSLVFKLYFSHLYIYRQFS